MGPLPRVGLLRGWCSPQLPAGLGATSRLPHCLLASLLSRTSFPFSSYRCNSPRNLLVLISAPASQRTQWHAPYRESGLSRRPSLDSRAFASRWAASVLSKLFPILLSMNLYGTGFSINSAYLAAMQGGFVMEEGFEVKAPGSRARQPIFLPTMICTVPTCQKCSRKMIMSTD